MIRWLEDNPMGVALAAVSAALLVSALLLGVVWSLPPSATQAAGSEQEDEQTPDIPSLTDSEPIERFAVITERPIFNPSRQPEMTMGSDEEGLDEEIEEDVDAPDVQLAGVVITPSLRMVTLKQKDANESLVAFEGQPLEGNFGSWHVSQIEPRQIVLASGSGEEMTLSLEVHDAPMAPPPKTEEKTAKADTRDRGVEEDGSRSDQPLTRAEEIRQRIAERREELRRAAEAEAEEDSAETRDSPQDYRKTIQSMITGNNRNRQQNEDEQ